MGIVDGDRKWQSLYCDVLADSIRWIVVAVDTDHNQSFVVIKSICAKTKTFPRGYGFLVDQLNRASLSIAANIAEGNGRFSKPDHKSVFGIARGSIQECVPRLELARRRNLIYDMQHKMLKDPLEEIGRMFSGLINALEGTDR